MKINAVKFIISAAFLFSLAYINKDMIPVPEELRTFDFIISSGIDIDLNDGSSEYFSISYISRTGTNNDESKQNSAKNIFNVKSNTLSKTFEKLHSLTNKSFNDSHLEYVLIGENTAKENLAYFIDYYSRSTSMRLSVKAFITKDMTSEDFIEKVMSSEIDADARLHGLVNDRSQLSSLTKKNLKDVMQIFYSENKTGLIPALAVQESPIKNPDNKGNTDDKDDDESGEDYTFEFYGLGIIKDGKLIDYLPRQLVRSYLILTGTLKTTDIEVKSEHDDLFVFTVKNSSNKISFEFNEIGKPKKVIFDINIDTEFDETTSNSGINNLFDLNKLQSDKIKAEIKEIIEISKNTNADFLNIGESLSVRHPNKWHVIKNDWHDIFKDIDYEINVNAKTKRYHNTNIKQQEQNQ